MPSSTHADPSPATALTPEDIDRIIQMAWEDRTAFDTIKIQFGVTEAQVIKLMRKHMKRSSFTMWRERVSGRKTKHLALRSDDVMRFKSSDQKGL
ncbi:TIGR03643 family protein [Actimicrobium sp. CCI2.3]|uniref:TIGR03643 family protein n=1 Tax=Actimicrobium sp. CCI2.3 TaxID=3048616 RepID=UPI003A0FEC4A